MTAPRSVAGDPVYVGVDLGGSSVRATGPARHIRDPARRPVGAGDDRAMLVAKMAAVVAEAAGGLSPSRVVVAIPSFVVDAAVGPIPSLPALEGARLDVLLADGVEAADVELVPDLTAAAIGEASLGAGRGVSRFLCVAVGTGVNAGAVVAGRIVDTAFGSFGDAGHVLVDSNGPRCPCGGIGCLESVCSAYALARDGREHGYPGAAAVIDGALAGEVAAVRLVNRAGVALGRAMSTWSVLVWPQVIAVAGGVSVAGDLLLEPARGELQRIGPPYVVEAIRVVPAQLGASATLAGAGLLAGQDVTGL